MKKATKYDSKKKAKFKKVCFPNQFKHAFHKKRVFKILKLISLCI